VILAGAADNGINYEAFSPITSFNRSDNGNHGARATDTPRAGECRRQSGRRRQAEQRQNSRRLRCHRPVRPHRRAALQIWRGPAAGIERIVKDQKIRNAVVLSGAGSVRGYQVHQVSNRDLPSKNMFVKDPTQPADVISMNGYVINGKVHAHMTMATPDRAFGGHLEPGTEVFTFGIVTLGVMKDGVDFSHLDDKSYR